MRSKDQSSVVGAPGQVSGQEYAGGKAAVLSRIL